MSISSEDVGNLLPVLVIKIGDQIYAVKTPTIKEVVPIMETRSFPDMPAFLEGFVDIRGTFYAVVDLRKRFGEQCEDYYCTFNRIVLLRDHRRNLGFIVDEVIGVEEWSEAHYQTGILSDAQSHFTGEIGKSQCGDVQIIQLEKILSENELALLAERTE